MLQGYDSTSYGYRDMAKRPKLKAKQKVIQNYLPLSLCNGLQPVLLGLCGFTHFRVQLALFPLNFLEIRKEKSIG